MATETVQVEAEAPPSPPAADPPQKESTGTAQAATKDKPAKDKPAKDKPAKGSKGKDSKPAKGASSTSGAEGPSVAAHPRAARSVALAKGWGGLSGFLIAGYLSLPTGTLADAGLRALVAGSVCYVAAWAAAVFVWRRLVMMEIRGREEQLIEASGSAPARLDSQAALERPSARTAS